MNLNELHPWPRVNKKTKRLGRGRGSGHGKTSGRGHKGQKSRAGHKLRPGFEGGQMPLTRRVPKRGFINRFKIKRQIVNLENLNQFKKDSTVTAEMLKAQGLIKRASWPFKILGKGKVSKALNIQTDQISKKAKEKIEQAGGKICCRP